MDILQAKLGDHLAELASLQSLGRTSLTHTSTDGLARCPSDRELFRTVAYRKGLTDAVTEIEPTSKVAWGPQEVEYTHSDPEWADFPPPRRARRRGFDLKGDGQSPFPKRHKVQAKAGMARPKVKARIGSKHERRARSAHRSLEGWWDSYHVRVP